MRGRIGLAGCGSWGANVLRDLVALGATVCVADRDQERRAHASAHGATAVVADAEDLPECDGYVVVTPASAHRDVCSTLLGRGAPVYVEKPPATSLQDVEALVAGAEGRLFVMHKWRYHPGVLAMAELATTGDLGMPILLETERTGPELLPADVDVTWHLGVHDLAVALEVLGFVPPVRSATGDAGPDGRFRRVEAELADDSGAAHRMVVAAGDPARVRRVRLEGSEATAELPSAEAAAVSLRTGDRIVEIPLPSEMPLERELRAFLDHVAGGPAPKSSAADALAICRRMEQIGSCARAGV